MKERHRLLIMMLIMVLSCMATVAVVVFVLYRAELTERQERLQAFVAVQARLMEAVAVYDISTTAALQGENPDFHSATATLGQIRSALGNYEGFGKTGELMLARRDGDAVVFLFRARAGDIDYPESLDIESAAADPMRRALEGFSGTALAVNDRGKSVIAAFEPVAVLNLGLVGTVTMAEIRSDFIPASVLAFIAALLLTAVSSVAFRKVSNPVIEKLSRHAKTLEKQLEIQKKTDTELKKWELVFRFAGWAVAITDAHEHKFLFVNRAFAEMHGYDLQEMRNVRQTEILSEEDQDHCSARAEQVQRAGSLVYESIHVRKDGSLFPATADVRAINDHQGNILYYAENIRDISDEKKHDEERRNLEQQMLQAQKLESLGLLAGGIAHDFNNLLMTILGNADIAQQDLPPNAPARSSIETIVNTARRAADLAKQMLAYSGKGRFVVEPVNLNTLAKEITHLIEVSISKKADLKYYFADKLPGIEGDATQIRQVMMNLIINASESVGDEGGVISLSTGVQDCDRKYLSNPNNSSLAGLDEPLPEGMYVFLEVSDTGCGMSEEVQHKLFDPFFTTKFTGRGLGMAAILGIVRGHRGMIQLYSEVGRGTTIKVLFPAMDHEATGASYIGSQKTADKWRGQGLVLVADDDESVVNLTKQYLQRMGYEAITAADGREAIDLFREHANEIVCVLMDMTMPNVDGEEAFREIRKIRQDAKVILCSGYNEQDATQHFVGRGLAGFLAKPYRPAELGEKLRQVLA